MKKLFCILVLLLALVCVFVACDNSDEHTHNFGAWSVSKNASCGTKGEEKRTCECGESETREIETLSHDWGEWITTTPATCGTKGVQMHICACGANEAREIPATNAHDYSTSGVCAICQNILSAKGPILSTEHFEVTVPMMSYMVYTEYQSLVSTYDSYSEQFGVMLSIPAGKGGTALDRSKSLREQIYATQDSEGEALAAPQTWFDHFAELAAADVKQMLAVCEDANANGVALEQADLDSIDVTMQTTAIYAAYYGYTTDGYLATMYGEGVTEKDVRAMMEISSLADKYNELKQEEIFSSVTDYEVNAEYEAQNPGNQGNKDDSVVRSVGHILFKTDTFKDLKSSEKLSGVTKVLADRVLKKNTTLSAELMAKELLALMIEEGKLTTKVENGKTYYVMDEQVFKAYGEQYTEDSNVFYDDVAVGKMVKEFEDWMFADERIKGEVSYPDAVKTDYGYHIMLYRGNEKPAWSHKIRSMLSEGKYDAWLETLLKETVYVYGEEALWNLIEG